VSTQETSSKAPAILIGLVVVGAGLAIVAAAFFAADRRFEAPRWVVGCAGGAFVFFGGWLAAVTAGGYDPRRPEETLPPPLVQLAVFVPGFLCFAGPFHWIAFWPSPRKFSSSFSLPFISVRTGSGGLGGRIAFGFGALLIDAILVATVVRLLRQAARPRERGGVSGKP
jgi:hypothetical protein